MIIVTYNFYDANGKCVNSNVVRNLELAGALALAHEDAAKHRKSQQLVAGNVRVFEVEGDKLGALVKLIDKLAEEGQNHGTTQAFEALIQIRDAIATVWA